MAHFRNSEILFTAGFIFYIIFIILVIYDLRLATDLKLIEKISWLIILILLMNFGALIYILNKMNRK